MSEGEPSTTGVKSDTTLCRIIETLNELATANRSMLADRLPVSKSTVHRLLTSLKRLGYVNQDGNQYALCLRFLGPNLSRLRCTAELPGKMDVTRSCIHLPMTPENCFSGFRPGKSLSGKDSSKYVPAVAAIRASAVLQSITL
ncbi:helix-turn-helix domain-containing protein [Haloarcula sp. JP-L23]|uniref:helix-turn-helix domain-containing protein n=1 Tax=Haloarcula sp. JP-L23 TaxID=2716717 RepID=UPI00140F2924|nr:helix-turn-helix domain-containing protein [Haloarcula sp. JP-L23]